MNRIESVARLVHTKEYSQMIPFQIQLNFLDTDFVSRKFIKIENIVVEIL